MKDSEAGSERHTNRRLFDANDPESTGIVQFRSTATDTRSPCGTTEDRNTRNCPDLWVGNPLIAGSSPPAPHQRRPENLPRPPHAQKANRRTRCVNIGASGIKIVELVIRQNRNVSRYTFARLALTFNGCSARRSGAPETPTKNQLSASIPEHPLPEIETFSALRDGVVVSSLIDYR
jgi:hypothetical protein